MADTLQAGKVRIGILGAADITPLALVDPASRIDEVELVAVAARDRGRAEAFASTHGIPTVLDSYQQIVDAEVDVIYNPLPASGHCQWTIAALEAGKHVLCEKPFSMNAAQAQRMIDAGTKADRLAVEAVHNWYHPMLQRVRSLVGEGPLGAAKHIEASFQVATVPPSAVYQDPALGGGTLMHIGFYPLHFMRSLVGEPEVLRAEGDKGPMGAESRLEADLRFASGVTGLLKSGTGGPPDVPMSMKATVIAEGGEMIAEGYVAPQYLGKLTVRVAGKPESVEDFTTAVSKHDTSYWFQLRAFTDAVLGGGTMHTSGEDTLGQMRAIDALYEAAGFGAFAG